MVTEDDRAAIARLDGAKPGPGELGGRVQDQGRPHRKRGRPSAETASLLNEYQAAMRDELRACLVELQGVDPPPALDLGGPAIGKQRPKLEQRMKLWDLAIKVGRELGTAVDVGPVSSSPATSAGPRKWRRGRVDYGPER